MTRLLLAVFGLLPMLASCEPEKKAMPESSAKPTEIPAGAETATLGAGCYWCIEAVYRQLDGVHSVTSGFMGGSVKNPTYAQVCEGDTGHAEVVQIVFDPRKISYERLLAWFWDLHDPTTLNRQGNDVGTQYRSAIFVHSAEQRKTAEASKTAAAKNFKNPIVTEITEASTFYPAPKDHQDYYFQNKSKNPYCRFVIEPKLKKLKLDH
jgi:peptide-methionine (S)-S-oxide reductase